MKCRQWIFPVFFLLHYRLSSVDGDFTVDLVIGNQAVLQAQVISVLFKCDSAGCRAAPVTPNNVVWSSPVLNWISEVKRVVYRGENAILATTQNGAVVFAYPSGEIVFDRQFLEEGCGVHSAEVLPDGNVAVVCATADSMRILSPVPRDAYTAQSLADTYQFQNIRYAHAVTFDRRKQQLLVLGYLNLYIFDYMTGGNYLSLNRTFSIEQNYYSSDHTENFDFEDGGHDLFPMDGSTDSLYLTTGERVFTINTETWQMQPHPTLFTLPSLNGQLNNVEVKFKGGVKSISRNHQQRVTFLHCSPWYKELVNSTTGDDYNYKAESSNLIWSFDEGNCVNPDFDVTTDCKIQWENFDVKFYKARLFSLPDFNYELPAINLLTQVTTKNSQDQVVDTVPAAATN